MSKYISQWGTSLSSALTTYLLHHTSIELSHSIFQLMLANSLPYYLLELSVRLVNVTSLASSIHCKLYLGHLLTVVRRQSKTKRGLKPIPLLQFDSRSSIFARICRILGVVREFQMLEFELLLNFINFEFPMMQDRPMDQPANGLTPSIFILLNNFNYILSSFCLLIRYFNSSPDVFLDGPY